MRSLTTSNLLIGLLSIIAFNACSKSQFQSSQTSLEKDGADQTGDGNSPGGKSGVKGSEVANFSVQLTKPQVDLVLYIDTAGTISPNDAKSIRDKVGSFAAQVADKSDLKVALVAHDTNYNPQVGIDKSSLGTTVEVKQISTKSLSTIGVAQLSLAAAAAVSCPPESNQRTLSGGVQKLELCGVESSKPLAYQGRELQEELSGALVGFLRPGAKRAYVFITKEEPFTFTGDDFNKAIQKSNQNLPPFVFAFTAGDNQGLKNLAMKTGGLSFDIKSSDWNGSFDKIGRQLLSIIGGEFVTTKKISKLTSPYQINESTVQESCFTKAENAIYVSLECIPRELGNVDVKVGYEYIQ